MIPLPFADAGEELLIRKIGGNQEVKHHLENLGFIPGGSVTVLQCLNGNLIVRVKESRIALDRDLAQKIMV